MFVDFFFKIKAAKIPATLREYLVLLEALQAHTVDPRIDEFYFLSRAALVKDEKHFDRYDRLFSEHFKGIDKAYDALPADIDAVDVMQRQAELLLGPEDLTEIEARGGWEAIAGAVRRKLEARDRTGDVPWEKQGDGAGEQKHPPAKQKGRSRADKRLWRSKIWEKREYRNYDDTLQLGVRNIQIALRRLREFARAGVDEELDLQRTIRNTAHNAGLLDIVMRPEEKNRVKVLMLFDVGGSMDDHIRMCEELFSAARNEFKHLEFFYFHNCVYEELWRDNARRHEQKISTQQTLNTYTKDYKLIFVGDAFMSPNELTDIDGSVEHFNKEPSVAWLGRLVDHWRHAIWLNPRPEARWSNTPSTLMIKDIMLGRMYPLSIEGLTRGLKTLRQ